MDGFRVRLEDMFKEACDAKNADAVIREYTRMPCYPTKQGHRLTEIASKMLHRISEIRTGLLEDFTPHPKILPQLKRHADRILDDPIDWATAGLLTVDSLLMEGRPVRLAG